MLNGTKQWISNGSEAGVALVIAAATGEPGSRERFSLFIVDPAAPGYKVLRVEDKLEPAHGAHRADPAGRTARARRQPGRRGRPWLLEGAGSAVGRPRGHRCAGRRHRAGARGGAALRAGARAYNQPISALQAIRFDLAEMAMQVDVARQYSLHAARLIDAGIPAARGVGDGQAVCQRDGRDRVLAGAAGARRLRIRQDFPVERYYRDVRVTKIYEGTSHIQKHIIARSLLG